MKPSPASPGWEVKFAPLDFKALDATGQFEGYASLFDQEDLGKDIIMPGAFAKCLKKRGASGVRMLFQHDPAEPIGVWDALREDANGLYVRGRLITDTARAREVRSLMRAGALDGLSIGFHTLKGRTDAKTGIRRLHEVDLWEISIVTFPMQPGARVSAVKSSMGGLPTEREFERWLMRDAGLTRRQAQTVIGRGYRAVTAGRDAAGQGLHPAALVAKIRQAAHRITS